MERPQYQQSLRESLEMSKGSDRRKALVPDEQVTDNWERIRRNSKNWGKKDEQCDLRGLSQQKGSSGNDDRDCPRNE